MSSLGLSQSNISSLVGGFHRNLLPGGIFCSPAGEREPRGKLQLPYEAVPLSFIVEEAGGPGLDRRQSILDIQPELLYHRTLLFIGSRELVEKTEEFIREDG